MRTPIGAGAACVTRHAGMSRRPTIDGCGSRLTAGLVCFWSRRPTRSNRPPVPATTQQTVFSPH